MTTLSERTEFTKKPLVSIIIPVYNDGEFIARSLHTALAQSLKNIEIICVDDCSTDNSVEVIKKFIKKDMRVRLVKQKENASAFQARRAGIEAARADYILFLDGDDEIHKDTAKLSLAQAKKTDSDIVGFGSRILRKDGSTSKDYEEAVQPTYKKLTGANMAKKLFEPDAPAQGQMWRYLFSKELLQKAYSYFPSDQRTYRINDLPIVFMSAVLAKKYTSIKNKLYIYHFYAGRSGSANFNFEKFEFYTKGIDSLNSLRDALVKSGHIDTVGNSYVSARLSVIYSVIQQIKNNLPSTYHKDAVQLLLTKVDVDEVVFALNNFIPEALNTIRDFLPFERVPGKSKNIALFTNNLRTGGLQAVVVSQAKYLQDAGFNVTIILLREDDIVFEIPKGINIEFIKVGQAYVRLQSFKSILQKHKIDSIIDHGILYNVSWPFFAMVAKSLGIKTDAWIHTFSLRPIVDGKANGQFLNENIHLIDDLAVLSKADVSYWKSLGHENTYYIPNPPSPLLLDNPETVKPKKAPKNHLKIVWFGRLQESAKRVYSLVDIAAELKKLTNDFTLTIVGPDSDDLTAREVIARVKADKLKDNVKVVGPKRGEDLIRELKSADVFLSTSIIEGYQLTLVEAQSYALPVVMYELPWIASAENNDGVIQTPQKNPKIAAQALYDIFTDKKIYEKMSIASLDASKAYRSFDFTKLFAQFVEHTLPKEFSPEINKKHMGMFIKWTQFYFASLVRGDSSAGNLEALKRKDAEIMALKNSKTMRAGMIIAKPIHIAKKVKHEVAKRLKK